MQLNMTLHILWYGMGIALIQKVDICHIRSGFVFKLHFLHPRRCSCNIGYKGSNPIKVGADEKQNS